MSDSTLAAVAPRAEAQIRTTDQHTAASAGDNAESSRRFLDDLQSSHQVSVARNDKDSAKDTDAVKGDKDSVNLADKTMAIADSLKDYLAHGGNFKDHKGQALAHGFIGALRKERDDHADDRKTDLQYSGEKGASEKLQGDIKFDSSQIGENAAVLNDPKLSGEARANVLKSIEASAEAISANVSENGGKAGKDLKDAASESKVIEADTAALASGKLTPQQEKAVTADIISKAGLIQKEMGDIPNEMSYAKHDSLAIKSGAQLEAVLKSSEHTHAGKSLKQLSGLLDNFHNGEGKGVLDTVKNDRLADAALEPVYVQTNTADNAVNKKVLEFSDPYNK